MRVLVTGVAGFIGSNVAVALLGRGDEVFGIDDLNDHYDVGLKRSRLALVERAGGPAFASLRSTSPIMKRLTPP